jgi:hypothetical protein
VTEREQETAQPRQLAAPGGCVETGQAIDGGEMVGIHAVLHAQHDRQRDQRIDAAAYRFHNALVRRFHIFS